MANCLYCGKKLRQHYCTNYEDTDKWRPLPKECNAQIGQGYEGCKGKIVKKGKTTEGQHFGECESCGMYYSSYDKVRRIVSRKVRERTYGSGPGDYGDGFFCGLRCGMGFAVVAARSGIRLKDKK